MLHSLVLKFEKPFLYFDIFLLVVAFLVLLYGVYALIFAGDSRADAYDAKNAIEVAGQAIVALILLIWPLCFYYPGSLVKGVALFLIVAGCVPLFFGWVAASAGGIGLGILLALPAFYIFLHAAFLLVR